MAGINRKRVLLGATAGAILWSVWTSIVTMGILGPTYAAEEKVGHVVSIPRSGAPVFFLSWFLTIFVVSGAAAWLYAAVRPVFGAGPKTGLIVGIALGFIASVPLALSVANWLAVTPTVPLFWLLDVWVGIILATFVSAYFYRD